MFEMEEIRQCQTCYWWGDIVQTNRFKKVVRGLCQCCDRDTYKTHTCKRWKSRDNYSYRMQPPKG